MSERIFLAKKIALGKAEFKTVALKKDGTFGELKTEPEEVKLELTVEATPEVALVEEKPKKRRFYKRKPKTDTD